MLSDEEKEALRNFKSEYETCDHYSSDLIIELDDAEIILNLIEKQSKEIEELNKSDASKEQSSMNYYNLYKELVDKIKAKILECREILYSFEKELELKANKDKFIHKESMNCLLSQISILQSLLEKEGE